MALIVFYELFSLMIFSFGSFRPSSTRNFIQSQNQCYSNLTLSTVLPVGNIVVDGANNFLIYYPTSVQNVLPGFVRDKCANYNFKLCHRNDNKRQTLVCASVARSLYFRT